MSSTTDNGAGLGPVAGQSRGRLVAALLALFFAVTVDLVWLWGRGWIHPMPPAPTTTARPSALPARTPVAKPIAPPTAPPATPEITSNSSRLLIPVAGVRPDQLHDTFDDARSEGRVHDAIDIPAPRGTPVLAAADGKIVRLFSSQRGGTTIYQLGQDNKTVYYYAHLDRYADDLAESRFVHQGETIAYVGDSGNAGAGNYHLHFAMWLIEDPRKYWSGTDINPYPLLRGAP